MVTVIFLYFVYVSVYFVGATKILSVLCFLTFFFFPLDVGLGYSPVGANTWKLEPT